MVNWSTLGPHELRSQPIRTKCQPPISPKSPKWPSSQSPITAGWARTKQAKFETLPFQKFEFVSDNFFKKQPSLCKAALVKNEGNQTSTFGDNKTFFLSPLDGWLKGDVSHVREHDQTICVWILKVSRLWNGSVIGLGRGSVVHTIPYHKHSPCSQRIFVFFSYKACVTSPAFFGVFTLYFYYVEQFSD